MWGVVCIFIGLLCGQMIKHACNRLHLPFTPFLTIFGMIVGYCSTLSSYLRHDEFMELSEEDQLSYLEDTSHSIGLQIAYALDGFKSPNPHLVILIFLPALIFESAYNSDYYTFKKQVFKILLLAGPVLLLCTVTTASVMLFIF